MFAENTGEGGYNQITAELKARLASLKEYYRDLKE
jgi:hypothetical protein